MELPEIVAEAAKVSLLSYTHILEYCLPKLQIPKLAGSIVNVWILSSDLILNSTVTFFEGQPKLGAYSWMQ